MSDSRGVARHTGFLLGAEVGIKIVTTAFYALLSRRVGVEGFGQWTYAMTFASLFMTPVNLGLSPLFIRETAASPASDLRSGVFVTLRVLSCAAAVAALVPVAWLLSGSTSPGLVLVCGVLFALSLITDLVRSVLRLQGRFVRDAMLNLVDRGGAALLAGTALLCGAALVGTAAAWTSCSVLSLTLAVLWTRASGWHWRWGAPPSAMRALIVQGAPLVILSVFAAVYFRQDILLVRWILGPRAR